MQEFTSISVSSYDAASLADKLTEKSSAGWDVMAIVPAGTNITAYLCRAADAAETAPSWDPVPTTPPPPPMTLPPHPPRTPTPGCDRDGRRTGPMRRQSRNRHPVGARTRRRGTGTGRGAGRLGRRPGACRSFPGERSLRHTRAGAVPPAVRRRRRRSASRSPRSPNTPANHGSGPPPLVTTLAQRTTPRRPGTKPASARAPPPNPELRAGRRPNRAAATKEQQQPKPSQFQLRRRSDRRIQSGGGLRSGVRRGEVRPRRQPPRRRCRPAGTPIRPVATNCATGTATRGPSTSRRRSAVHRPAGRLTPAGACCVATSIGHAGMLIETRRVDPVRSLVRARVLRIVVRVPPQRPLDDDLVERIEHADFLYVSHLHGDHHDEPWLREHLRRDIPILLPGYPTREQRRTLARARVHRVRPHGRHRGGRDRSRSDVAIHVETSITDGPGGDSALVVIDGETILVNQNDCRTNDLAALRAHGPVDLHWLQFSGAIWYPMVYEMPDDDEARAVRGEGRQPVRPGDALRGGVDARAVVPSAGPPCFLDADLFGLNMIDGDELSIFPDQRAFLERLERRRPPWPAGHARHHDRRDARRDRRHPSDPRRRRRAIFDDKRSYLAGTRPTGSRGSTR